MTPERLAEVERICHEALFLPVQERAAFVGGATGDEAVRRDVLALLEAEQAGEELFEGAGCHDVGTAGPYAVVGLLGEGGMGVVYRARQTQPVERDVALKVLHPGMASGSWQARFQVEQQALARMDHPNIARVLDFGETSRGLPYMAMELVEGVPITRYCEERILSVRQRLELMVPVCQAIHHAHQKGVIHRDIKPSNVLVAVYDGVPAPKVIDFGIAKAIEPDLSGREGQTSPGMMIGTFDYMSPEQAGWNAKGVDVRADVYSLGALFYELMAGVPPIEGLSQGESNLVTVMERIQYEVPRVPSERVRNGLLPRECDWIAMKALEKDRERRYESAAAMARDLERWIAGQPVDAGPPSTIYRVSKFAMRYRAWVAAGIAFVAVLLGGTVTSSLQAIRADEAEKRAIVERDRARGAEQVARQERDRAVAAEGEMRRSRALTVAEKARADKQAATAKAVASFLQDDLLAQAGPTAQATPGAAPNPNITVRALLDRAGDRLKTKFQKQPEVRATLEQTIANAYSDLGQFAKVREHALEAVALRTKHLGATDPLTLAPMDLLANAYRAEGKLSEAERILKDLMIRRRKLFGESDPTTLKSMHNLAMVYNSQGKAKDAVALYEQVLPLRRKVLGADHSDTLRTANNLAYAYNFVGKPDAAISLHQDTLERLRRTKGNEYPDTLVSMSNLATAYEQVGRFADARAILDPTLAKQRKLLGDTHPSVMSTVMNLTRVMVSQSDAKAAVELTRGVVDKAVAAGQERHPVVLTLTNNLGMAYNAAGQLEEAERVLRRTATVSREVLGPDHPDTIRLELTLATTFRKAKKFAEGEALLQRVIAERSKTLGPEHGATLQVMARLVELYLDAGRFAEAAEMSKRVWELRQRVSGEADGATVDALVQRVRAATGMGEFQTTVELLGRGLGMVDNMAPRARTALAEAAVQATEALTRAGQTDLAAGIQRQTSGLK